MEKKTIHEYKCTCPRERRATPERPHMSGCPREPIIGEECPICSWEIQADVYDGGEIVIDGCSDFCVQINKEEREKYAAGLKENEWGIWPCAECGCPVEDEYTKGGICGSCYCPKCEKLKEEIADLRDKMWYYRDQRDFLEGKGYCG